MTDDAHCGGCNAPCASYQTCSAGECVHNECAAVESASPPTHACLETRVRDGFRSDTSPLCLQTNTATDQTCHLPASVCTSGSNGCDVDARVVSVTASGPMTGTGGNQVVVLTVDVAVDADLTYAGAHGIAIPFFGDPCTLTVRSDEEAGEVFRADVVLNGRIDETSGEFVAGCAGDSTGGLQNIQPNYVLSLSGDFGQGCNLAGAIITSVQAIINALITDQVLGEVCNGGMERRCLPCDDSCTTDSGLTCSLTAP